MPEQYTAIFGEHGFTYQGKFYPYIAGGDGTEDGGDGNGESGDQGDGSGSDSQGADDLAGLKSALAKEREANKANAKLLKDLQQFKQDTETANKTEEQRIQDTLAELTPKAQRAERLEAALTAQLEASRKDLPAHIIGLLDKLDTADQLEWLAANQEALKPAVSSGGPANPARSRGSASLEDQADALLSPESRKFWGF